MTTDYQPRTKSYQFAGTFTALSSITHFGDSAGGTEQVLRREKVLQPDGSVEEVPIISGNSWRGQLRDAGMRTMLEDLSIALGREIRLSPPAFHLLFSGGALTKDAGRGIDIAGARALTDLIPFLSVLGGAVGRQILQGKCVVEKIVPICVETRHLLPNDLQDHVQAQRSIYDRLSIEHYTRMDDAKRESLAGRFLPAGQQALLEAPKTKTVTNKKTGKAEEIADEPGVAQQMRFGCVTADTPMLLADGRILTAEQVMALCEADEMVHLVSYDLARQRMTTAPIVRAEHWCVPETIEIRTRLGYSIRGAVDHRLLTWQNGEYAWKTLEDLHVGDYVALAAETPHDPDAAILSPLDIHAPSSAVITMDLAQRLITFYDTTNLFRRNDIILKNGRLVSSHRHRPNLMAFPDQPYTSEPCPFHVRVAALQQALVDGHVTLSELQRHLLAIVPASRSSVPMRPQWELDPDHLHLLGLLLSDGFFRPTGQGLSFASIKPTQRALFRELVHRHFGLLPSRETSNAIDYTNTELTRFFLRTFHLRPGPKSRTVRVPALVFRLPPIFRQAFVDGYQAGDGTTYQAHEGERIFGEVRVIVSTSPGLVQDMVYLLASLGHAASRVTSDRPDRLAAKHQRQMPKMHRVEWCPALATKKMILPPGAGYGLKPWRVEQGISLAQFARQTGISEETIKRYEGSLPGMGSSVATATAVALHSSISPAILNAPLNWTRIQEVHRYEGDTQIYAFEIPEFHNYIAGTGPFVSHNCEVFGAGTVFSCGVRLRYVTPLEFEAFMVALRTWSEDPILGGRSSIGHGRVALHFPSWVATRPQLHVETAVSTEPFGTLYQQHIEQRGAEIVRALEAIG